MKTLISRIAAAWLIGSLLAAHTAIAQVPDLDMNAAYSAIRTIETDGERISQRYYQDSAAVHRMETELGGEQSIIIMRGDRNLMWTVMPQQRMVMELSLGAATSMDGMFELPGDDHWTSVERLGRESVNGVPATRWRVVSDDGAGERGEGDLWVSDEGIPVRMDMRFDGGRVRMTLSELLIGPQPATLFEPPVGYQRIAPGGAGGLFGGQ